MVDASGRRRPDPRLDALQLPSWVTSLPSLLVLWFGTPQGSRLVGVPGEERVWGCVLGVLVPRGRGRCVRSTNSSNVCNTQ